MYPTLKSRSGGFLLGWEDLTSAQGRETVARGRGFQMSSCMFSLTREKQPRVTIGKKEQCHCLLSTLALQTHLLEAGLIECQVGESCS